MLRHQCRPPALPDGRAGPPREMSVCRRSAAVGRQVALEAAGDRQRNLPALLGHHHGDGVVLLGQADRGAVARAEIAPDDRIDGQRQEAGRGGDAILLNDDRAVMERRARAERSSPAGRS